MLVLAVAGGVLVSMYNGHAVSISYHFGQVELPLGIVVFIALFVGSIFGMLIMGGAWLRAVRRAASFRKQLKASQKEVAELSALPSQTTALAKLTK